MAENLENLDQILEDLYEDFDVSSFQNTRGDIYGFNADELKRKCPIIWKFIKYRNTLKLSRLDPDILKKKQDGRLASNNVNNLVIFFYFFI